MNFEIKSLQLNAFFRTILHTASLSLLLGGGDAAAVDISKILEKLNEQEATFTKVEAEALLVDEDIPSRNHAEYLQSVLDKSNIVGENDRGETLYTTQKYERAEKFAISEFKKQIGAKAKLTPASSLVSEVLKKYQYFSDEQVKAARGLCESGSGCILIGRAGTGKTILLKAVAEIYKKSGAQVIGMSLSALASENLGKSAEIESHSIAYWLHNNWKGSEGQTPSSGGVMIVDEAGMIGAAQWSKILRAAKKFGMKLIIVGDNHQFNPISAGDCFRLFVSLAKNARGALFELTQIFRQKNLWMREASSQFAHLDTAKALASYRDHDRVHAVEDVVAAVTQKYLELNADADNVILCFSKKQCDDINKAIRSARRARHDIGGDIVTINGKGLAKGERVIFLKNNKKVGVKNGQIGTIAGFNDGVLTVKIDELPIDIDTDIYDEIDYAYSITLHKSQGKTFDNTIIVADKGMDSRACYVAMTRHRLSADLFYDEAIFKSFDDFAKSVSRYSSKPLLSPYGD